MMENEVNNKDWHLIRNDNGEWISDEYAVLLTPLDATVLEARAAQQGKPFSVQHGVEGQLWCYRHELETIDLSAYKPANRKLKINVKQAKKMTYLGRGLRLNFKDNDNKWTKAFAKDGKLKGLLDEVRNDKDLVVQIRDDYFNVYYKGGNLLKVKSANSFGFDSNYYKGDPDFRDEDKDRKDKRKNLLKALKREGKWEEFIINMKKLMDDYWVWLENREKNKRNLDEKSTQHQLCISNTENSEYTIIDLEFQISTREDCLYHYVKPCKPAGRCVNEKKKSPRFDIIAVRNKDHQLCVIELKKGVEALYGKSGIGDHADSFEGSIGRYPQAFIEEMKVVVEDKKELGLLDKKFFMKDDKPEFLYAYTFTTDDEKGKAEERNAFEKEQKAKKCTNYRVIYLNKGDYTLHD